MKHINIISLIIFLLGMSLVFLENPAYSFLSSTSISVDKNGNSRNNFNSEEHVYGKTTGLSLTDGTYPLYVVAHDPTWWLNGENIPNSIDPPGTTNDPESNIEVNNGNIQKDVSGTPEDIWKNPPSSETEKYDIIVDMDDNGKISSGDLIDSITTYGFSLPVELSFFTAIHENDTVKLKWTTESEVDHIGWNIYRSEKEDGKFVKINEELIEGAGNSAMPHDYTFVDKTAYPDCNYHYYLEGISIAGERDKSEIITATPLGQNRNVCFLLLGLK